jgi:hypothetical protein
MKSARLGVQALIVIALIVLVSRPQFRPLRAASVWLTPEETSAANETAEFVEQLSSTDRRAAAGRGRRFAGSTTDEERARQLAAGRSAEDQKQRFFFTPPGVSNLGGKLNALVGRARTSANTPIPYAKVLLRNIRTGQIEARATANEEGQFSFLDLANSNYIVELIGPDGSVVASSEMVALAPGDLKEATVRIAVNSAAVMAGAFNGSVNTTLTQATSVAMLNNVTRTSGQFDVAAVSPSR